MAQIIHQLIPNDCVDVDKTCGIGLMSETVLSTYFCVTVPGILPCVLKRKRSNVPFYFDLLDVNMMIQRCCGEVEYVYSYNYLYNIILQN